MIEKILSEEDASSRTVLEGTPEDFAQIARKLQLEAAKSYPGREVFLKISNSVVVKYDPGVTTKKHTGRPVEPIKPITDEEILQKVNEDELMQERATTH